MEQPSRPRKRRYAWQLALAHILSRGWVEMFVGALIILSVILTLSEFALTSSAVLRTSPSAETPQSPTDEAPSSAASALALRALHRANLTLTIIFVVELLLRWAAVGSTRRFLREYWLDVVAVVPSLLPDLGPARLMRIVRLLRILRIFGFMRRFSSSFPYILRRGMVEYATIIGLLVLTVTVGTGFLIVFEKQRSFGDAFWFSLYSMFAGEPVGGEPKTIGGHVVTVCVMFMGVTVFAMLTGTVSAFMVERIRTKERVVDWDELHDHVVICGWNSKAEIILREFRASHISNETPIVVIAQWEHEPPALGHDLQSQVRFLVDDFTRVSALEQAGIHRAKTCILLSDSSGGRSEQDADARTILAALTVEKLNPSVYTCAELHNADYGSHLEMGRINDYVVTGEHSAYLLAQAAMNRGLMGVFAELLTYERGNQFYRVPLPDHWASHSFSELFVELKASHNAILVAVHGEQGLRINPREYQFQQGDEVILIADREISLVGQSQGQSKSR